MRPQNENNIIVNCILPKQKVHNSQLYCYRVIVSTIDDRDTMRRKKSEGNRKSNQNSEYIFNRKHVFIPGNDANAIRVTIISKAEVFTQLFHQV